MPLLWLPLLWLLAAAPALAADIGYTVRLVPSGVAALDQAAAAGSGLMSLRTVAPAGAFALVLRARQDLRRLHQVLESDGYDSGRVEITLDGLAADLPDAAARLESARQPVAVVIRLHPGPLFHVRRVIVDGSLPGGMRLDLAPGAAARAGDLIAAGNALQAGLRADGYPYAQVASPMGMVVAGAPLLDVTYKVTVGPHATLGPLEISGLHGVDPGYVRRRAGLVPGQAYSPAALAAAHDALLGSGLFTAASVSPAPALDAARQVPVRVALVERPIHAVRFSALYATDLGATLGTSWRDRNLFGAGQSLELKAAATQLGGTATSVPGYDLGATFTVPDWLRRDQDLSVSAEGLRAYLPAYDRTAIILGTSLSRPLGRYWQASLGVAATQEQVNQEASIYDYTLLALPARLRFDDTNSLLNPTRGVRAQLTITPTQSMGHSQRAFLRMELSGSTYLDASALLGEAAGRSVLALRAALGSAPGISPLALPPDQRFYAGGGGSVRGYRYQSLGPRFPSLHPEGGTGLATGSVEWRQMVVGNWQAVGFLDAGQVQAQGVPALGALRLGAGGGVRYLTSFGPIRLDVAVPVNPRPGDDRFEIYIGLGQAF